MNLHFIDQSLCLFVRVEGGGSLAVHASKTVQGTRSTLFLGGEVIVHLGLVGCNEPLYHCL
jgi:hypothetical protein